MDMKTHDPVPSEYKPSKYTDDISLLFENTQSSIPLALAVHIKNQGACLDCNSKLSSYGFPCFSYEKA